MSVNLNGVFPSALPEEPADLFVTNKEIIALEKKGIVFLKKSIPLHIAAMTILIIVALAGIAVICVGYYVQGIFEIAVGLVLTILAFFCLQAFVGLIKLTRRLPEELNTAVEFIRGIARPVSSLKLVSDAQKKTTENTLRLYQELTSLTDKEAKLKGSLHTILLGLQSKRDRDSQRRSQEET
ncbi:hypothetical protein C10C_0405 [Chlamydia serpentis]|uniref:Uncharacterized protein n=1 Tax=Chlamydia serpentis TaxID=1967782 RepID=A0A2R8FAZ8_9CHLA|nr:cell division protein ZapA [Chlamydia serpentis]SPN73574.1 hypothetical protein C10C_0405 [Chlamydia serpentis]